MQYSSEVEAIAESCYTTTLGGATHPTRVISDTQHADSRRRMKKAEENATEKLPSESTFLLDSFARVLKTVRSQHCTAGLLRLVHSIPEILRAVPPKSLGDSLGVADAVAETIDDLLVGRESKFPVDAESRAAVYTAAVSVAVKRARLPQLLKVTHQLLTLPPSMDAVCEGKGEDEPYMSAPFLSDMYDDNESEVGLIFSRLRAPLLVNGKRRRSDRSHCHRNVLEPGWLMTFGRADNGKLCHGHVIDSRPLPTFVEALQSIELADFDSLSAHCLAVTKQGKLIAWGRRNDDGKKRDDRERDTVDISSSSWDLAGTTNENGGTVEWPRLVVALSGVKTRSVVCGLGHVLVLLADGQVYAWGNGANGRLGLGDSESRKKPTLVSNLDGRVKYVACGASHSLAITDAGTAYAWGKNSEGQCGQGTRDDIRSPKQFLGIAGAVRMVVGGWEHTLALLDEGNVFSFGSGYRDARRGAVPPVLGFGTSERHLLPRKIEDLEDVVHIACGWDHSLAVSSTGALYTWGSGAHGKLGHGDEENRNRPTLVTALSSFRVVLAGGGSEHSAAITSSGELFTWGQSDGGRLGLSLPTTVHESGLGPHESTPQQVKSLVWKNVRATGLSVGDKYTMLLVRSRDDPAEEKIDDDESFSDEGDADKFFDISRFRSQPAFQIRDNDSTMHPTQVALKVLSQLDKHSSRFLPDESFRYDPEALVINSVFKRQLITASRYKCNSHSVTLPQQSNNDGDEDDRSCFGGGEDEDDGGGRGNIASDWNFDSQSSSQLSIPDTLPSDWPFSVDTSIQTFQMLSMLLETYAECLDSHHEGMSELWQDVARDLPTAASVSWIVLFYSLRILQSNIFWLSVHDEAARASSAPAAPTGKMNNKDNSPPRTSDASPENNMHGFSKVQALPWITLSEQEEASMTDVLNRIHTTLFKILAGPASVSSCNARLQLEAAEVLKIGFRQFYPSAESRAILLRSLVFSAHVRNSIAFKVLVDQVIRNEPSLSVVATTFVVGSSHAPHALNADDLQTLMRKLLEDIMQTEKLATDPSNLSPQRNLLLCLQDSMFSFWIDNEIFSSACVCRAALKSPDRLQECTLCHIDCIFSYAERILDDCAAAAYGAREVHSGAYNLHTLVRPAVASLCRAFDPKAKVTLAALEAVTHLLPTAMRLLEKIDSVNIEQKNSICEYESLGHIASSCARNDHWIAIFETHLSRAAACMSSTLCKPSDLSCDHRIPDDSLSAFDRASFWLDHSKLFALGSVNWVAEDYIPGDLEDVNVTRMESILREVRAWESQGYGSVLDRNRFGITPSLSTETIPPVLGDRLATLEASDSQHHESFLMDLLHASSDSAGAAFEERLLASSLDVGMNVSSSGTRREQADSFTRGWESLLADHQTVISASRGVQCFRRALFAVLLKSSGHVDDAMRIGKAALDASCREEAKTEVPIMIRAAWSCAQMGLSLLLRVIDSSVLSDSDKEDLFDKIGSRAITNATFLVKAKRLPPVEMQGDTVTGKSAALSRHECLQESHEGRKSDFKCLVSSLHQLPNSRHVEFEEPWLSNMNLSLGLCQRACAREEIRQPHRLSVDPDLSQLVRFLVSPVPPRDILKAMKRRKVRASLRMAGIDLFHHILSKIKLAKARCELIKIIGGTFAFCSESHQDARGCGNFLNDLCGAGTLQIFAVQESMTRLYSLLKDIFVDQIDSESRDFDTEVALIRAHAVELIPSDPWFLAPCTISSSPPPPAKQLEIPRGFPMFENISQVLKLLARLLKTKADILAFPSNQFVQICSWQDPRCPWRSIDSILGKIGSRETRFVESERVLSSDIYRRHVLNTMVWRTMHILAMQVCASPDNREPPCIGNLGRNGSKSSRSVLENDGSRDAVLEVLFALLCDEISRTHDRLEELVNAKRRFARAYSLSKSRLLFGGILRAGKNLIQVPVDTGELNSNDGHSISFWLWLPDASTDNAKVSDGQRYDCVAISTVEHGTKGEGGSLSDIQRAIPRVAVCFESSRGWHIEMSIVGTALTATPRETDSSSPQPREERILQISSTQSLTTRTWLHVCCTIMVTRSAKSSLHDEQRGRAGRMSDITAQLVIDKELFASQTVNVKHRIKIACREFIIGGHRSSTPAPDRREFCEFLLADVSWHGCVLELSSIVDLHASSVQGVRHAHHAHVGAYLLNFLVLLEHLTKTKEGSVRLASAPWPTLFAKLLRVTGASCQFHILRMLRTLAGPTATEFIMGVREAMHDTEVKREPNVLAGGSGASLANALRKGAAHSVIENLCGLLGEASRLGDRSRESLDISPDEPQPAFFSTLACTRSAEIFNECKLSPRVDASTTRTLGCGVGGSAHLRPVDTERHGLASEIILLLRWLLQAPGWRDAILTYFASAMSFLPDMVRHERGQLSLYDQYRREGAAIAVLHVLGGHIEGPRIGLRVLVPSGLEAVVENERYRVSRVSRGTVVHFSNKYGKAFVSIDASDCENVTLMQMSHHPVENISEELHKRESVGVVVPLGDLICEADIPEESLLPSFPSSSLNALRFLVQYEPISSVDLPDSVSNGESFHERSLNPKLMSEKASKALCSWRLRCHSLRAIARQATFAASASYLLKEAFMEPLLSLATTDISGFRTDLFGASSSNDVLSTIEAFHSKLFGGKSLSHSNTGGKQKASKMQGKLSPTDLITALEMFVQAASSHISFGTLQSSRLPWHKSTSQKILQQGLEALAGDVSIDGYRACAIRHFPSVHLRGVLLHGGGLPSEDTSQLIAGGRWYYEVVLLTDGLMQIGWADNRFVCDPVRGQGVGDHSHSWAIDGFRQKIWCLNSKSYGERWQTGDVLGVLLDLNLYEMRFYLNGRDLGVAFRGFRGQGIFPAASLNDGQAAHFNFGTSQFMHPPSGIDGLPFRAVADATPSSRSSSRASTNAESVLDGVVPIDTVEENRPTSAFEQNRAVPMHDNNINATSESPTGSPFPMDTETSDDLGFGLRHVSTSAEEDVVAEIELRQQHLIENLIGMGFPVEWAIRAAESCNATLNESVAIAWIIERMGEENEKNDDGENFHSTLNYTDDGDEYEGDGIEIGHGASGLMTDTFATDRYHIDEYYHHCASAAAAAAAAATQGEVQEYEKEHLLVNDLSSTEELAQAGELGSNSIYLHAGFPRILGRDSDEASLAGEYIASEETLTLEYDCLFSSKNRSNKLARFLEEQLNSEELVITATIAYSVLTILYARASLMNVLEHVCTGVQYVERPLSPISKDHQSVVGQTRTFGDVLIESICKQDSASSILKLFKLVIFRSAGPHNALEESLCTATQWKINAFQCSSRSAEKRVAWSRVNSTLSRDVGLHPLSCLVASYNFLLHLASYGQKNSASDCGSDVCFRVIPTLLSLTIDEVISSFESAHHDDYEQVDWNNIDRCLQTDYEALVQPNIRWACWALESMMSIAEDFLVPRSHTTPNDNAIVCGLAEVFSVALFGSLLDAARGPNLSLRQAAFQLCSRILRAVRIARDKSEEGTLLLPSFSLSIPESYLSSTRERHLLRVFASQFCKEASSRVLLSPYLQSLFSMLVHWRQLYPSASEVCEVSLSQEDEALCKSESGEEETSDALHITIEELAPNGVTISWTEEERDDTYEGHRDHRNASRRYSLESRIITNFFGSEPFVEVVPHVDPSATFFVLDSLHADTRYSVRLVRSDGLNGQPLSPSPAPALIFEAEALVRGVSTKDVLAGFQPDVDIEHQQTKTYGPSVTFVTPQEVMLKLNAEAKGPNLVVSNDSSTVTNKQNKKWNACLATTGFTNGTHTWDVLVNKCVSKNIFIGVARAESALDNYVGSDCHGWGYLANKAIWHNKGKIKSYGELFKERDTITVHLDMDAGNLRFSRNGHDLGIAVEGLDGCLYPAFSLYNKDDQITLLPPDTRGDSCGCGVGKSRNSSMHASCLAEEMVTGAIEALNTLRTVATEARAVSPSELPIPQRNSAMIKRVWKFWRRWQQSGPVLSVCAADGRIVTLDTSQGSLDTFGLRIGDQIETPKGVATVAGVANHHLWHFLDGSNQYFAMCWSQRQVYEMRSNSLEFHFPPTSKVISPRAELIHDFPIESVIDWFERWTPGMDADLVRYIDTLTTPRLPTYVEYSDVTPSALCKYQTLSQIPLPEIMARIALLIYINTKLMPLLPLTDLDPLLECTTVEQLLREDNNPQLSRFDAESLPEIIKANSFRIFGSTKRNLLARLIRRQSSALDDSETHDVKSAIPMLELIDDIRLSDRVLRLKSSNPRFFEEWKLAASFFGQSCAQLSSVSPTNTCHQVMHRKAHAPSPSPAPSPQEECDVQACALRIVIRDAQSPSDALNENSFAEEYLRFFDRICTDVCDECLFTHVHNSTPPRFAVNRSFIASTSAMTIDPSRLALYRAFGHLVGLALRTGVALPKLRLSKATWKMFLGVKPTLSDLAQDDEKVLRVVKCLESMRTHLHENDNDLSAGMSFDDNQLLADLHRSSTIYGGETREYPLRIPTQSRHNDPHETVEMAAQLAAGVLDGRIDEVVPMIAAFRVGIESVFPRRILSLFTMEEIEDALHNSLGSEFSSPNDRGSSGRVKCVVRMAQAPPLPDSGFDFFNP